MTEAQISPAPISFEALDYFVNGPAFRQASALFLATRFLPPSVTVEQVDDAIASTRRCLELEVFALCEERGVDGLMWQILANTAQPAFDSYLNELMVHAQALGGAWVYH
jgi:hypothetical protein